MYSRPSCIFYELARMIWRLEVLLVLLEEIGSGGFLFNVEARA